MSIQNKIVITDFSAGDVSGSRGIQFFNNQSATSQWVVGAVANANSNFYITNGSGNLRLSIDADGKVMVPGDMQINSNLTVNGTTTFINTCVMTIEDPQLQLGLQDAVNITSVQRYLNLFKSTSPPAGYFSTPSSGAVYDSAKFPYYVFNVSSDVPATFTVGSNVFVTGTGISGLDDSLVELAESYISTTGTTAAVTSLTARQFAVKGASAEINSASTPTNWALGASYTYAGVGTNATLDNTAAQAGGAGTALTSPLTYNSASTPALPTTAYAGKVQSLVNQYPGIAVVGVNATGGLVSENISYSEQHEYWTFSSNQYVAQSESIMFGQNDGRTRISGYNNLDMNVGENLNITSAAASKGVNITTGSGGVVQITDGADAAKLNLGSSSHQVALASGNLNITTTGNQNTTATQDIVLTHGSGKVVQIAASAGAATLEIAGDGTELTSDNSTLTATVGNFSVVADNNVSLSASSGNVSAIHANSEALLVKSQDASIAKINLLNSSQQITASSSNMNLTASAGNLNLSSGDNTVVEHGSGDALLVKGASGANARMNMFNANTYIESNGSTLTLSADAISLDSSSLTFAAANLNFTAEDNIGLFHGNSAQDFITLGTDGTLATNVRIYNSSTTMSSNGVDLTLSAADIKLTHAVGEAVIVSSGSAGKIELVNANHVVSSDGTNLLLTESIGNVAVSAATNVSLTTGSAGVVVLSNGSGAVKVHLGGQDNRIETDSNNDLTLTSSGDVTVDASSITLSADTGALALQSATSELTMSVFGANTTVKSNGSTMTLSAVDLRAVATDDLELVHGNQSGDHLLLGTNGTMATNVYLYNSSTTLASNGVDVTLTASDIKLTHAVGEAVIVSSGSAGKIELVNGSHIVASDGTNISITEAVGNVAVSAATNVSLTSGASSFFVLSNGSGAQVVLHDTNNTIKTNGTDMNVSTAGNFSLVAAEDASIQHGSGDSVLITGASSSNARLDLFNATTYIESNGSTLKLGADAIVLDSSSLTFAAANLNFTADDNVGIFHGNQSGDHITLGTDGTMATAVYLHNASTTLASNGVDMTLTASDIKLTHAVGEAVIVSSGSAGKIELVNANHVVSSDGTNLLLTESIGNVAVSAATNVSVTTGSAGVIVLSNGSGAVKVHLGGQDNRIETDSNNDFTLTSSGDVTVDASSITLSADTGALALQSATSELTMSVFGANTTVKSNGSTMTLSAVDLRAVATDDLELVHGNQSGDHLLLGTNGTMATNVYLYNSSTTLASNGVDVTLTASDIKLTHAVGEAVIVSSGSAGKIELVSDSHSIASDGTNISITEAVGNVLVSAATNVSLTSGASSFFVLSNGAGAQVVLHDTNNTIKTDGTNMNVSTAGNYSLVAAEDATIQHGSGDSLLIKGASSSNAVVELFNANTYLQSNGSTLTISADTIALDSDALSFSAANVNFTASDNIGIFHGNQSGDHITLGTDGTMATNVFIHNSNTYMTSDGANITTVAATNMNLTATAGNYNFTNSTARLVLHNTNTYVQGNGSQVKVQADSGVSVDVANAGNFNVNLGGAGDINLLAQNGYNVNIAVNSSITFDGGNDQFFIKHNGSNYLIIHGANIEAQGNFVSTAIGGSSDRRLKENITPYENALETIQKMRGVNFTWIAKPEAGNQIGFIAQEIEAIHPELTLHDSKGFLAVQYGNITAILVEAVKDQQRQIAEMRNDYNAKIALILDAFQAQTQYISELSARMNPQ